jgi:hypothetical protein
MLFLFSYISRYGHGSKAQRKNACPAHVLQAAQAFCLPAYMRESDLFHYNVYIHLKTLILRCFSLSIF